MKKTAPSLAAVKLWWAMQLPIPECRRVLQQSDDEEVRRMAGVYARKLYDNLPSGAQREVVRAYHKMVGGDRYGLRIIERKPNRTARAKNGTRQSNGFAA